MIRSHLSEDTVSQSGWLFADLLLALSVVFLATISFIPDREVQTPGGAPNLGKLVQSEGFSRIYQEASVSSLSRDLNEFRAQNAVSSTSRIVHLQIIGSSAKNSDSSGALDALRFSLAIQNSDLREFEEVTTTLMTSERLLPGQIAVRAVFATERIIED